MSKREDDPQSDLEVGMTTAERRRRRRRGAGLRVPSDNVPRRTNPPVVAPVPEDPSLAMSIAYSFTSDASEPIPVAQGDDGQAYADPAAPEALSTVIDSLSGPIEQTDFEMKTREMSAVDLEGLGLAGQQGAAGGRGDGASARGEPAGDDARHPRGARAQTRPDSSEELDVEIADDVEEPTTIAPPPQQPQPQRGRERLKTVALSDEDLEEVREAVRSMEAERAGQAAQPQPQAAQAAQSQQYPAQAQTPGSGPIPTTPAPHGAVASPIPHAPSGPAQAQPAPQAGQGPQPAAPRPLQTPPQGASAVPRPHTPTPPPPISAPRVERSAADEMWGEDTPLPRTTTKELPRVEERHARAETSPPVSPPQPKPIAVPTPTVDPTNRTQPLSALDLERADDSSGVPEIDLDDRAEGSGEFEVDVDADADAEEIDSPAPPPADARRPHSTSIPPQASASAAAPAAAPPAAQAAVSAAAVAAPAAVPAAAAAPGAPAAPAKDAHAHAHPPPPPPAALHHHPKAPPAPPTPPQTAKKDGAAKPAQPAQSSGSAPAQSRVNTDTRLRAKPWFVEVFDEDYLRTLPFLTPQATQAEAEFVANAMQLTPGAQVLDVGCGYGRHAMELAARGFHVVGLDLSTPLLLRGGEEAQRRGLQINFVRGDMRELDFDSQFDGAYCLFSTFGYFDDETNKRTAANIARALKPGGRVLIEILNRDYVIADLPTRVWWEGDGCVVLEEVELNYFSSRIQVNRSVVFDDGRQVEQEISIRAYSLHEVGKLMHAAGFRVLEVSGGYQTRGRFFGNQSRHIIVLAERKDPAAT